MVRLYLAAAVLWFGAVSTTYYGSPEGAKKPAAITASAVFQKIPEYREIQEKKYDSGDPEYWSLLARANEKFYAAVRKVAERDTYDVVVEVGSAGFPDAPDVTARVISALP